jgi:hypothetical protein
MGSKIRIQQWQSLGFAKKTLRKRLQECIEKQDPFTRQWETNMRTMYGTELKLETGASFHSHVEALQIRAESTEDVAINYVFKHVRLIHAQMSANPPSVIARPTSSDGDDKRKADAADRLVRHLMRKLILGEKFDMATLQTCILGTGVLKTYFNGLGGDIAEYDEESGEVEMEGAIAVEVPSMFDIFVDPAAKSVDEIRFVFERMWIPLEDAISRWPEHADRLKAMLKSHNERQIKERATESFDRVEVFEYWEKGLPQNAMLGRYAVCDRTGDLLEDPRSNPFRFSPMLTPSEKAKKKSAEESGKAYRAPPPTAHLPYHFLTDVDVIGTPLGKSFVEYEANIQEVINKMDSTQLENVKAHAVSRLVLPESAEISDDSLTNSPWDFVKITGSQPPFFVSQPGQFPDAVDLRAKLQEGGNDMAGVNDAMYGNMKRETSGFTMQYATNQGNMVRRRLFNKYTMVVEAVYRALINLVIKHWDESHTISVLGAERAFETIDLRGADVNGGYDLVVEYGASLSLDPQSRREEIMALMPLFEKAGLDTKTLLGMLRLNELEGMYDIMELAAERQREIFEEMISSGRFIEPRELSEHAGMLAFAYRYIMTAEYKYLPENMKVLIEQHIKAREKFVADQAAPAMPAAPGPTPSGPAGPMPVAPPPAGALPPMGALPA